MEEDDKRYLDKAVETAEAADTVNDPLEKLQLLKLAQGYIRLAEHVRKHQFEQPAPDPRGPLVDGHATLVTGTEQ